MQKWELKCLNIKEESPHHHTVKRDPSIFNIQLASSGVCRTWLPAKKKKSSKKNAPGPVGVEALAHQMRRRPSLHQGAMQAVQIVAWTSPWDAARLASVPPTFPASMVVSPACGHGTSSRGNVGGGDDIDPPRCALSP